jgi:hypothetical protein
VRRGRLARAAGLALAPLAELAVVMRRRRVREHEGEVYRAIVVPLPSVDGARAELARRLAGPALVRLSALHHGVVAIRFGDDQDLIFAPHTRFRVDGLVGRAKFRLVPAHDEDRSVLLLELRARDTAGFVVIAEVRLREREKIDPASLRFSWRRTGRGIRA